MTQEQLERSREISRNYYNRNKDKAKAYREANKEKRKQYRKEYLEKNREVLAEGRREKNADYWTIYCLSNNYVGVTVNIKRRLQEHKQKGRDISNYTILDTVSTEQEALLLEAQYHSKGYLGKHINGKKL